PPRPALMLEVRPAPGRAQGAGQHEGGAQDQGEVGRTQQRLDVGLEPEQLVPDEVGRTRRQPRRAAQQGEPVSRRQGLPPAAAARPAPGPGAGQERRAGEPAPVEHGVPGREEGVVDAAVGVRPAVQVQAADEDGSQDGHGPVEERAGLEPIHRETSSRGWRTTALLGSSACTIRSTTASRAVASSIGIGSGSPWRCMAYSATHSRTSTAVAAGLGTGRQRPPGVRAAGDPSVPPDSPPPLPPPNTPPPPATPPPHTLTPTTHR